MTHLYPVHDVIVGSVAGLEPSHEFGEVRGGGHQKPKLLQSRDTRCVLNRIMKDTRKANCVLEDEIQNCNSALDHCTCI